MRAKLWSGRRAPALVMAARCPLPSHLVDHDTLVLRILRRDMRRMRSARRAQFVRLMGVAPWWTGQVSAAGLPLLTSSSPAALLPLQHTSRAAARRRVTHLEDLLSRKVGDPDTFIAARWRCPPPPPRRKRKRPRPAPADPGSPPRKRPQPADPGSPPRKRPQPADAGDPGDHSGPGIFTVLCRAWLFPW